MDDGGRENKLVDANERVGSTRKIDVCMLDGRGRRPPKGLFGCSGTTTGRRQQVCLNDQCVFGIDGWTLCLGML